MTTHRYERIIAGIGITAVLLVIVLFTAGFLSALLA